MASGTYRKPSVKVGITSERANPPLISGDDVLMILGESNIYPESFTDVVKLVGNSSNILSREGIDDATITVQRRSTPSINLVLNTNYTIVQSTDSLGKINTAIAKKFTNVVDEVSGFASSGASDSLAQQNLRAGSVVVTNNGNTVTYEEGTDYWVDYAAGIISHIIGGSIIVPITNLKVDYAYSSIIDDDSLLVNYQYTPSDQFEIQTHQNINHIIDFYGPAMSGDSIYSPISMAAELMAAAVIGSAMPTIKTLALAPNESGIGNVNVVDASDFSAALNNKIGAESDITHL